MALTGGPGLRFGPRSATMKIHYVELNDKTMEILGKMIFRARLPEPAANARV
jgi:hypothetical protein